MSLLIFYILVSLPALGGRALAVRIFGFGDGEGWALGRTLGLVLVAFPAWWAGVVGIARWQSVGVIILVAFTVWGVVDLFRHRPDWRSLAAAEFVFLLSSGLVIWLRLARPEILNQEKFMDLGILASLIRAEGFPPPDMWLAGENLPYYYWGALIWIVPLILSKIPLDLAFNFVVAAVGGLTACLLWSLGGRAGKGRGSGWLAVAFGLFAGTADGFRQLLAGRPIAGLDYWHSSRQVPDTITEWPLFTLWLGDLHPHLLAMPLALAAVLLAWQAGRLGPRPSLVIGTAVLFGLTWAANPWAMPPTFVAVALMLLCGDGRWHWPGRKGWRNWVACLVVGLGGWLAAAPFHLSFHPPFQGVKIVTEWTEPLTLLLWGGIVLFPVGVTAWVLVSGILGNGLAGRASAASLAAATLVFASLTGYPTLVILGVVLLILVVAAIKGAEWPFRPGVALAALGVFLLLVPEVIYVVDTYGHKMHRMNTVFKCYIQAWVFLAVAFPALLAVGFQRRQTKLLALAGLTVLALPHLVGMGVQPLIGRAVGIDGLAWMDPADRAIVRYLRTQPRGTVIAEAAGGAYTKYARISSASGVPAILGWANHEMVWRGQDASEITDARRRLLERIYQSGNAETVAAAARDAGVDIVVIGALENRDFSPEHLDAVRAAGEAMPVGDGGQIVRFDKDGE